MEVEQIIYQMNAYREGFEGINCTKKNYGRIKKRKGCKDYGNYYFGDCNAEDEYASIVSDY